MEIRTNDLRKVLWSATFIGVFNELVSLAFGFLSVSGIRAYFLVISLITWFDGDK